MAVWPLPRRGRAFSPLRCGAGRRTGRRAGPLSGLRAGRPIVRLALAAGLLLALPAVARAEVVEELIELPSGTSDSSGASGPAGADRAEGTDRAGEAAGPRLPVLLSRDSAQPPHTVAVLFNGGGGAVGLRRRIPRPGANFLVRSRDLFVQRGVLTAVIDVPTDLASLSDSLRMSDRHVEDVRRLVAELRRRHPTLPVYLVGTSRGTVSSAYAGARLGDAVAGVVSTASVFNATRGGPGLSGFDWRTIRTRLLFVHHVDDACVATPYFMAQRVAAGRTLVSVRGGDAPRSEPCEAFSAHGFLGVEAPVVDAIVRWMRGEVPPATVP